MKLKLNCALRISVGLFLAVCFSGISFAQDTKDSKDLTKCICESKTGQLACMDELKAPYFKDNKFGDFVGLLRGLCPENKAITPMVNYYIALARYTQLKHLEESQLWDEYFAKGNDYRDDIASSGKKALDATTPKDIVNVYTSLLLYQFHKDQQDAFVDDALSSLMNSVSGYAAAGSDIKTIKEVADKLLGYGELKQARDLYKIYAQQLSGSNIKDAELKDIALGFYKDGNMELAENIYDIYIERISKSFAKEKLTQELTGIAKDFVYKDSGAKDMLYAESIFKKIEALAGKDAFSEELMYLRGFNLEKAKEYAQAKDIYLDFIKKFPRSIRLDELNYKIGIIYTYILRDSKTGIEYFNKLINSGSSSGQALASFYQLGLLKQWGGDFAAAKDYYNKLIEKPGDLDPDRLTLTRARLKEIEEGRPIEYNLKTAMDIALKDEYANLDVSNAQLKADFYQPQINKEVNISSSTSIGPSGCLQVELQYLWSGDLGGITPAVTQSEFKTSYKAKGTQVINMVLISSSGIVGRSLDMIDAY